MMPLSLCLLAMQGKYILFLSSYFPLPMRGRNEKISEKKVWKGTKKGYSLMIVLQY